MRRSGQKWISDTLIGSLGADLVFPDAHLGWIEQGMALQDYRRTMARVRSVAMLSKAWSGTGDVLAGQGEEAEARGHGETALEFFHRAAFCYAKSFWASKDPVAHERLRETYDRALAHAGGLARKVEFEYQGATVYGVLHLPPGDAPAPCVIFIPGMDMVKEEYPNLRSNRFSQRGIACLSLDGPGQGETWLHGLNVDADNYAGVGSAAIDFLEAEGSVDPTALGVFGVSMGSYWAPTVAAADARVKACAAAMGCFLQKRTIFDLAPPSFRSNMMLMAGIDDDDEFDDLADQMTLERYADRLTCPTLLVHGEFDQLCPLEDARELFAMLHCPKELWVFENEFHALGRLRGEMFSWVADWLKDRLAGKPLEGDGCETWVKEYS